MQQQNKERGGIRAQLFLSDASCCHPHPAEVEESSLLPTSLQAAAAPVDSLLTSRCVCLHVRGYEGEGEQGRLCGVFLLVGCDVSQTRITGGGNRDCLYAGDAELNWLPDNPL